MFSRSSSREVRIRVPVFVFFGREPSQPKTDQKDTDVLIRFLRDLRSWRSNSLLP